MNTDKVNKRNSSEEGKKILYRLLLMAVAVVYALVFILDYLLQLHFTFFLLLSLFGFVIMTLLYMWFKVSGVEVPGNHVNELHAEEEATPSLLALPDDLFEDAIFIINPETGLTIDCTSSAATLFEAQQRGQLIGIDLSLLFDVSWEAHDRSTIKSGLFRDGRVAVEGKFKTLSGRVFHARLEGVRRQVENETLFTIRIQETNEEIATTDSFNVERTDDAYFPTACIGLNYRFVNSNKAFGDLTGYTDEDLLHKQFSDLMLTEDRFIERRQLADLFSGKVEVSKKAKRIVRRNNEVIWIQTTSTLVRNETGQPKYIILMAENITQRKKLEKTMADDSSRLSAFIENAEYAVVSVDHHHTILLINEKLSDQLFVLTGIVVERGFHILDILPKDFHEEYLQLHKRAFSGESVNHQRTLTVNENKVEIELILTPVKDEAGTIRSISIFGHDVTARKEAEKELIRSRDKAEAATQAKSGFLATMSHEIRTPLNGVIGMGRLLSQTPLTPKQQEFVDSILLSGEALLSVINDILDYSKIESSKMELEYKPFALKRCIEETFDLLSSKAIEKNLSLHYFIARDVPGFIYGDITRLRQILMNLVSNAIKFTIEGTITIKVTTDVIENGNIRLHFSVQDTGVGIQKDKIGKLFNPFSQADVSTSRNFGGTGLGLAICKNLVGLMGGKIWVDSTERIGSDFQFTMKTSGVAVSDIPTSRGSGTNRLANSYVLIISDDNVDAEVYANYFRRWGMIPQLVGDVRSALQIVKERSDFNLVLINSQMVTLKALDVAREIRISRSKEMLPIIMFNADREGEMYFDYTNEIVSAVIPQNIDRSKVLDILISVFSIENHQRNQHEEDIRTAGKKLSEQVPMRILIAEDNHINQKLAQNIFEGLGYHPVIVSNGLQVIDKLKGQTFDLIFMDVQMPEMDGLEATRFIIHKMNLTKRPFIVAMTAFALEGDKEKCIEAGMDDYISKPFLVEEIIEKIIKWGSVQNTYEVNDVKKNKLEPATELINQQIIGRLKDMTTGGDTNFFGQVIQMFFEQAEEIISDLNQHGQTDAKLVTSQAHKLKGSALNIGASGVAEICRRLELKGREMDLENITVEIKKLSEIFILTKQELKKMI